jgi:hypothetical protein
MEIGNLSVGELKALAYDIIAKLEVEKGNLNTVNRLIEEKMKQEERAAKRAAAEAAKESKKKPVKKPALAPKAAAKVAPKK